MSTTIAEGATAISARLMVLRRRVALLTIGGIALGIITSQVIVIAVGLVLAYAVEYRYFQVMTTGVVLLIKELERARQVRGSKDTMLLADTALYELSPLVWPLRLSAAWRLLLALVIIAPPMAMPWMAYAVALGCLLLGIDFFLKPHAEWRSRDLLRQARLPGPKQRVAM